VVTSGFADVQTFNCYGVNENYIYMSAGTYYLCAATIGGLLQVEFISGTGTISPVGNCKTQTCPPPTTTTTTSTTTTTTTLPAPFTACMSDFSDASACDCDGLSYGTWTFNGSGATICTSTTITSTGILSEITNNGYFWIASAGQVRYYRKNGTSSSATAQAACFACPTTTTTTTTTSTTTTTTTNPYEFYEFAQFECNGTTGGCIATANTNECVGFPVGTSVLSTRYYKPAAADGYAYKYVSGPNAPCSPALLMTTVGSSTNCGTVLACPTTTTTTTTSTTTTTTTLPPFQNIVCVSVEGGDQDSACNSCPQAFTMTGNFSTFCTSTIFTADTWYYTATGNYWLSFGGQVLRVTHTVGQNTATLISAGCQTCPAPITTTTTTTSTTTTTTTAAAAYDYYLADEYNCNQPPCSTRRAIDVPVVFPAGYSYNSTHYYTPLSQDGYIYKITGPNSPETSLILDPTLPHGTNCVSVCAV
jgi:hypothetical protein